MKSFWLRLWSTLNFVYPYQGMIYAGLLGWAVYNLFRPEVTPVSETMPGNAYNIWLAMHIAAPTVTWIGQWM